MTNIFKMIIFLQPPQISPPTNNSTENKCNSYSICSNQLRDGFGNHPNESYNGPISQFGRRTFRRPSRNGREDQRQ